MNREELAKAIFFEALDLSEAGEYARAEALLRGVLALVPERSSVLYNLAAVLFRQKKTGQALACAERAMALDPKNADALLILGASQLTQTRLDDALASFDKLIALSPDNIEAYVGRAETLLQLARHADAVSAYDVVLGMDPRYAYAKGNRAFARLMICDWNGIEADLSAVIADARRSLPACPPFPMLSMSALAADQLACARKIVGEKYSPVEPTWKGERYGHERIHVGYLSPDLREHAVSYLTAGLFEHHDRSRFKVVAISTGDNDDSSMRARLASAFEHFVDARGRSEEDIAGLIRSMEIDVLVDLAGATLGAHPRVLAMRPAPVQVSYLGYPATMGWNCLDYMIADPFVVPAASQPFYAEKIVYLPECFQANDDKRPVPSAAPSRASVGLPQSGFVFCCFNTTHKILPATFDVWMRLLAAVPEAVLWIVAGAEQARNNLRREVARRGVDSRRLIFAEKLEYEDHLARLQLADLFLDTLPFNAGATASDALWAGVPLVTCAGEAFASRMAGSLLRAVGLPELVTDNLADYEALALDLARSPLRLATIRQRLVNIRGTTPLFDTARFTRHLEGAYVEMWQRAERGEPPQAFAVPSLGAT